MYFMSVEIWDVIIVKFIFMHIVVNINQNIIIIFINEASSTKEISCNLKKAVKYINDTNIYLVYLYYKLK